MTSEPDARMKAKFTCKTFFSETNYVVCPTISGQHALLLAKMTNATNDDAERPIADQRYAVQSLFMPEQARQDDVTAKVEHAARDDEQLAHELQHRVYNQELDVWDSQHGGLVVSPDRQAAMKARIETARQARVDVAIPASAGTTTMPRPSDASGMRRRIGAEHKSS